MEHAQLLTCRLQVALQPRAIDRSRSLGLATKDFHVAVDRQSGIHLCLHYTAEFRLSKNAAIIQLYDELYRAQW
jgi:hypothetical protein